MVNSMRGGKPSTGYRPGRLVEPFAFHRNGDRDNDIHIQTHGLPLTHTYISLEATNRNNKSTGTQTKQIKNNNKSIQRHQKKKKWKTQEKQEKRNGNREGAKSQTDRDAQKTNRHGQINQQRNVSKTRK